MFAFISQNMPNLQRVMLWMKIYAPDLEGILDGKVGQGWVKAFRKITVHRGFEVHLLLDFHPRRGIRYNGQGPNDKGIKEIHRKGEEGLTRLLMPKSLKGARDMSRP
jgi:hypothetical protein